MLTDCHVHSRGTEKIGEVTSAMDQAGVDKAVIIAPYPGQIGRSPGISPAPTGYMGFSYLEVTEDLQRKSTRFVSGLQNEAPDRVIAFAWIEPRLKNAVRNLEEAVTKYECKGIKMMPDHWYPYESKFFPLYEKVQELDVPLLFHSGILFGFKDSSRFCRPCNYEVLINFPKARFALAHVSWPWTDECIALYGRFRANLKADSILATDKRAEEMQMYIDLTPGTPKFYRRDVLRKALAYGAADHMLFGSDSLATSFQHARDIAEMDKSILTALGYSDEVVEGIQSKNIERFLKGHHP
ncbi:MAG: amidohydrolase family protein [Nitrososphaerota archaeon]